MTRINCPSESAIYMSRSVVTRSFPTQVLQQRTPSSSLLSLSHFCPLAIAMSTLSLIPSNVSSRTVVSADRFEIQPQFEEAIHNNLREAKGFHELVITNVPPGWEDFLWEVEEDLPTIRKTYNPESRCLRLKIMPTYIHNCIFEWISTSISRASGTGFLNAAEIGLILPQPDTSEFN